jgi:hypothetical protein
LESPCVCVCVVDALVRTHPSHHRLGRYVCSGCPLSASPNRPFERLRLPSSVSLSCRGTSRTGRPLEFPDPAVWCTLSNCTRTALFQMTTLGASLTNRTAFLHETRDSSRHVSEAKCPLRPTHVPLLRRVDSTDRIVA